MTDVGHGLVTNSYEKDTTLFVIKKTHYCFTGSIRSRFFSTSSQHFAKHFPQQTSSKANPTKNALSLSSSNGFINAAIPSIPKDATTPDLAILFLFFFVHLVYAFARKSSKSDSSFVFSSFHSLMVHHIVLHICKFVIIDQIAVQTYEIISFDEILKQYQFDQINHQQFFLLVNSFQTDPNNANEFAIDCFVN